MSFEYYSVEGISSGLTLLSDVPIEKSRDGTGFYQTETNVFTIPTCTEIVMDFDVYFNGTQRWRAFNGFAWDRTGIILQGTGQLSIWVNNGGATKHFPNVLKANTLQNIRFHMISSSTDGLIEVWVDGKFIGSYSGNINDGNALDKLYLQSDGAGTFFSNFYISDTIPDWLTIIEFADSACNVRNTNYAPQTDGLSIWLPFIYTPTEDYCQNFWLDNVGDSILAIRPAPEGINQDEALFFTGYEVSSDKAKVGRLWLNCQGMYLGGRDFTVSFDWWYGGAFPFSTTYPFGVWNEDYTSGIAIACTERFNANFQRLQLQALGQSTELKSFNYQQWHAVKLEYKHEAGQLTLYLDETSIGELAITIPRTFYKHVEIDRAAENYHGSGYLSDLKLSGGEVTADCGGAPIYLAVIHAGAIELLPFYSYWYIDRLAVAIYHDQRAWYNVLREVDDTDFASDIPVRYGGKTYALSKV